MRAWGANNMGPSGGPAQVREPRLSMVDDGPMMAISRREDQVKSSVIEARFVEQSSEEGFFHCSCIKPTLSMTSISPRALLRMRHWPSIVFTLVFAYCESAEPIFKKGMYLYILPNDY